MRLPLVPLALLLALAAASAAVATTTPAKVQLRATSLGKVLVDARGHTLYLFEADKAGKSACYGACAAVWPPFVTSARATAGAGVKRGLLGTVRRKDGKLQVTYKGHPLYFFASDRKAGQANGEGIDHLGGEWYAVSAAGTKVEESAPTGTTTTAPPGGGYDPYPPR